MEQKEKDVIVRLNVEILLKDRYKLKEIAAKRNLPLRVIVMRAIAKYIAEEKQYE